eukprot:193897-Amphidinium_carterae.1
MDEFRKTVNLCLSQLAIEMKKVEDKTGAQVLQMRLRKSRVCVFPRMRIRGCALNLAEWKR